MQPIPLAFVAPVPIPLALLEPLELEAPLALLAPFIRPPNILFEWRFSNPRLRIAWPSEAKTY